jgi:aminoglycoside phosphotransferase (APT) family kinase protein
MTFGKEALDWLARALGIPSCSTGTTSRHLDIVPMKGSTSSSLFLVQCSCGSNSSAPAERFALRVLDNHVWLAQEPDLAAHEAAVLEETNKAGLPAPKLIAYSSQDVGFGVPVVLMSFIEGHVELRPANFPQWLDGLAGQLASIHRHAADGFPWHFSSWLNKAALMPPQWTAVPRLWEQAIELVREPEPDTYPVFIHRDYHPTNVLWQQDTAGEKLPWPVLWIG